MRFILFFLLLCVAVHAHSLTVTDDAGTQVTFDEPPQRIVALAPNLTELAYAAGLGSRLVAVSAYSDYPMQARQLPQVGDAFYLDWEQLVALEPDLVLAWGSTMSAIDRTAFENLKLNLLVLEPKRLDDIPKVLRLLGRIANTEATAEAAALDFEKQRKALRKKYAGRPIVRTYFQISDAPLLSVNGKHVISDVLRLCGAQNIFSDAPLLVPPVMEEELVYAQPQVMLGIAATLKEREEAARLWNNLPLSAVQLGHIGFIHPDLISRSSPRILLGAQEACELIEAMRDEPGVLTPPRPASSLQQQKGALCCNHLSWQLPGVADVRSGNPALSCTIWPSLFYQLPVPY